MTLPKFDPKNIDSFLKLVGSVTGAVALVVVLILYFDNKAARPRTAAQADAADTSLYSLFEVTLKGHARQSNEDQKALLAQLEVIESIARDTLAEQKTANAISRLRYTFEKCLAEAGDNDKRRTACAAGSR